MFRGDRYPGRRTLASARPWYMPVRPACLPACLLACLLVGNDRFACLASRCAGSILPTSLTMRHRATPATLTKNAFRWRVMCAHTCAKDPLLCDSSPFLSLSLFLFLAASHPRALKLIPIMISREKDAIQIELVAQSQCSVSP